MFARILKHLDILYVSMRQMCARERSWLEARALGMGDCNFTHGVTHCSAMLHLSAYPPATGSLPRYSSIPLRRSITLRRVFSFRSFIVQVQPHAMEYPFPRCLSLSSTLPFFLVSHLLTLVLLSRATLRYSSRFVTSGTPTVLSPLSDGP